MNAEPEVQLLLLQIQGLDSELDRLTHQARTLPVLAVIAEIEARLADLGSLIVAGETEVSDLKREQAKADTDVEQVRERSNRDRQRMDAGAVSAAKELQALEHEIASLAKRQAELEDVELEVMERLEDAQSSLNTLVAERAELTEKLQGHASERDAALNEKLRASGRGVGAAALHRGRCQGCHLEINASELKAIREADADEVLRCEECRRILIRTAESGL